MERIMEKLKDEGISLTPQRIAIIKYLAGNKTHPTVDEIYRHIKAEYPTISKATVYSTLELLSKIGELEELSIRKRGEASFDLGKGDHHHFLCRECNRIIDILVDHCDDCNIIDAANSEGHKIERIHSYLYGICNECLKRKKSD